MKKSILVLSAMLLFVLAHAQFNATFRKYYTIVEDYTFVDNYTDALPYLLKLDSLVPNNPNVLFQTGMCYLLSKKSTDLAISFLEQATPSVSADYYGKFNETTAPVFTFYYLGMAYQEINEFDKAIENFSRFKYYLTNEDLDWMRDVNRKMEQVYTAKRYYGNPIRTKTQNLGEIVNTEFPEYAPIMSPDLSYLIFTSRRSGSTGEKKDLTGQFFEDLYIADYNGQNETFSNVRPLSGGVNTTGHEASISISWDGNTLFIYRDDKGDGNIYMSTKENGEWTTAVKLSAPVNSKHYENHAFLSPDGATLYFVSNRPGGFGGKDIWSCKRLGENKWGDPINLGSKINTPYNEDSPTMLSDGVSLYFSSEGHENMGGYDVFVSIMENGQWSTPINLCYPINTTGDDIFFVPTLDGHKGYFATNRPDGFGNLDIYQIIVTEPMDMMATVKGYIRDTTNNSIILANIDVYDLTNDQPIVKTSNNRTDGEFIFTVPVGRSYEITIQTSSGQVIVDRFDVPDQKAQQLSFFKPYYLVSQEHFVQLDTLIKNVNVGQRMGDRFVLRNVHFDFDKYTLRPESEKELNELVQFLNDNPQIKIELLGHTDNRGSESYNQKLSENRAMAVVAYLIDHGISADRLRFHGFGFNQPIASNETDMGRQLNRRVEFRIVGTGTFENISYAAINQTGYKYPVDSTFSHRGDQNSDIQKTTNFYIISGSFTYLKNAERSKQYYQTKGYTEAEILGLNSVGTFRVALKMFPTKDEALKELPKIRKSLDDESIWILEY
jgi:outer membrane protein OmpA-like peptidoglycan-associated protein